MARLQPPRVRQTHLRWHGCLCLLFAGLIGASPVSRPALAATPDNATKAKAAELEQLRDRLRGLRAGLDEARGRQSGAQEQLRRSEQEISRATQALARIDQALAAGTAHLTELQEREQAEQVAIAAQRAGLAHQVRAAYLLGRQEPLKLLLNQDDPARLDRALAYYGYLNRARLARIAAVNARLQALKTIEAEIMRENTRLQELRAQQVVEQEGLRQQRAERAAALAAANAEISDKGAQIARLEEDQRNLQRVLQELQDALADFPDISDSQQPFASLKGRLPLPVRGRLAARFGTSRGAGMPPWRGLLIEARVGSQVRAVARGRVAFAEWLRGFGLLMIIDHGGGYMSLYGHNQSLYKETGEWVAAGEIIAGAGDSGGQARNGVYFEIRQRGQPVDPLAWCRRSVNDHARAP